MATKLETAFNACLAEDLYPGPVTLARLMDRKSDTLSGPECRQRRRLMRQHHVAFQRDSPYGKSGQVPKRRRFANIFGNEEWRD
jgi:hypothetical protein